MRQTKEACNFAKSIARQTRRPQYRILEDDSQWGVLLLQRRPLLRWFVFCLSRGAQALTLSPFLFAN
jgi:hypothetical protein